MNVYKSYCIFLLIFCCLGSLWGQTNLPPEISVSGRQAYCPLSQIPIATNFSITDPDDSGIDVFFIQISSGYNINIDRLILTGNHPGINASWNNIEGKLTLEPVGAAEILYTDLEAAVRDVVYESLNTIISQEKFFSFNIGDANYLPSTDHFYEYVADLGIDWNSARQAAENRTYFGLQGYLATITNADEAQLTGEQAAGAGWIGGSDVDEEGIWRWMTGPEAGTIFWTGGISGTSPNFAFWNTNEPNNLGDEDYAHVTDPSVGIPGSWNDLDINGNTSGPYQPKGYIVEYGGTSGDPDLNISGSTSIYIPQIVTSTNGEICLTGSTILTATPSEGVVMWYDAQTGGNLLATGNSFTTPVLSTSTTYYAAVSVNGCLTVPRTPVEAIVEAIPEITNVVDDLICAGSTTFVSATSTAGQIVWYDSLTSTTPISTGPTLATPELFATTTYYVEAVLAGCVSSTREPVTVTVDSTVPSFDIPTRATLCVDQGSVRVNTRNANDDYTYEWRNENGILVSSTPSVIITTPGTYTVVATSLAGCVSEPQTVEVSESELANFTLDNIVIDDVSENNTIRIRTDNLGIGSYEFAIDSPNGNFQNTTFFQNITPGLHTLYIRDRGGCGTASFQFSVLDYPSFFTPNGDGINDEWHLKGIDAGFYSTSEIRIYNRYGVLVATLDASSGGWNGISKGWRLPSNDYWFSVRLTDNNGLTVERKGHFSLLRR